MNKNTILTIIGSIVVIVGFLVLVYQSSVEKDKVATQPIESVKTITKDDHVKWASKSMHTLVEYSDFQCPACASFHPVLKELEADKEVGAKVRFVYRHYPLRQIHPNAMSAAVAAEAAGRQGKFFDYHDILFENQSDWSEEKNPQKMYEKYATELGLDLKKFQADLKDKALVQRVERDISSGAQAGITGTPSFYLNGTKLDFTTVDDFTKQIKAALAK